MISTFFSITCRRGGGDFDEFAGLMNNKERQWLLNIQIIQLATDKPHIDDYYYMVSIIMKKKVFKLAHLIKSLFKLTSIDKPKKTCFWNNVNLNQFFPAFFNEKVWKKKQEKERKMKEDNRNGMKRDKPNREPFFANNRQQYNEGNHRERRDSERDAAATPSPRVYVPLQFENSLGRLQVIFSNFFKIFGK